MSQIFDYIFLKDKKVKEINVESEEHVITYKLMERYEEQYLGNSIDKFDCREVKLFKF